MAQFPPSFGTAFAVAGFSFDPNLSPNNQSFANAVLATVQRAGLPFGFEAANVVLAGPASGAAALPTYRALTAADVPGGVNGFGNPSNLVSGTATNGTSTLAMRSDAAPALDWAQSPTWTGTHVFNGGVMPILVGTSTQYGWGAAGTGTWGPAVQLGMAGGINFDRANPTVRLWGGIYWNGTNAIYTGTNTNNSGTSTGVALVLGGGQMLVQFGGPGGTYGGTAVLTNVFAVLGTSGAVVRGFGPNAAALVDMTPDTGSFNGTFSGFTTTINPGCVWAKNGNLVTLTIGAATGTSNATTFTMTGLPAALQAVRTQAIALPEGFVDNGGALVSTAAMTVTNNGTLTFYLAGNASGWGNTLLKGFAQTIAVSWILN